MSSLGDVLSRSVRGRVHCGFTLVEQVFMAKLSKSAQVLANRENHGMHDMHRILWLQASLYSRINDLPLLAQSIQTTIIATRCLPRSVQAGHIYSLIVPSTTGMKRSVHLSYLEIPAEEAKMSVEGGSSSDSLILLLASKWLAIFPHEPAAFWDTLLPLHGCSVHHHPVVHSQAVVSRTSRILFATAGCLYGPDRHRLHPDLRCSRRKDQYDNSSERHRA